MFKALLFLVGLASAKVVHYDWKVEWVTAAPNGVERPVIGINGAWPVPPIEVDIGDRVIIDVYNGLGNETTSLHWHGLFQAGTNHMDGPAFVAQCPIPPGDKFKYDFTVKQSGTYWYHAHIGAQYTDGLRGPFIIRDPHNDPHKDLYDEEYTLTVSDWYNDEVPTLLAEQLFRPNNTNSQPPIPVAGLLNDYNNVARNQTFKIVPGKRYMFRIINVSALTPVYMWIDGHKMTIVEVDGLYHQPAEAEMISIAPAQRYNVIVQAKDTADENFPFTAVFDRNPNLRITPLGYQVNTTIWLEYDESKPLPQPSTVDNFNAIFDDVNLVPYDSMSALGTPDKSFTLDFTFELDEFGVPRAYFNGVTYVPQNTPSLYTALTVGDQATNPVVYGQTNPMVVEKGEVVEIILNNHTPGHHPFHLHGHHFQVISRSPFNAGVYQGDADPNASPMRRDTVQLEGFGNVVLRFKADNPGVWLFHCHIEWHINMGLVATVIEAPLDLQEILPFDSIPKEQLEICEKQCMPTQGNAAGNVEDPLDLTGARTVPMFPDTGALYTPSSCAHSSSTSSAYEPTSSSSTSSSDGPEPTCDGKHCGGGGHGHGDGHNDGCSDDEACGGHGHGHGGPKPTTTVTVPCPGGYVCHGPDKSKPTGGSHCEDDVYWMTVTEAFYYTSYETTTSTMCAVPTKW